MKFEALNKCENLFRGIANFYNKWNFEPESIILELDEQNSTKLRITNSALKRQSIVNYNSEIKVIWLKKSFVKTPWVWNVHTDKLYFKGKTKHLPPLYILTGRDVHAWLYINRIVELSADECLIQLDREISEVETNTRRVRLKGFLYLLKSLKDVVDQFKGKSHSFISNDFVNTDKEVADWQDIYQTLLDLADNQIKPLIEQYLVKINSYLPTTDANENEIPEPTISNHPYTDVEKLKYVGFFLAPLKGLNPQKEIIMHPKDFDRLIEYADHLVLTNTVPSNIIPFIKINISNEHIRFTFYRLHKKLFGTRRIKDSFIDLLHAVFSQFAGTTPVTTKAKFSTAPKSYETDFADYFGEEA